jgi:ribosome-binding factor A
MRHQRDESGHERADGRVTSALTRALRQALVEGLADPRLDGTLVTVTGGALSPDGLAFTAGISVLPEQAGPLALQALRHAAGHLKQGMARHVEIRRMPRLEFRLDDSLKRQGALDASLARGATDGNTHEGTA